MTKRCWFIDIKSLDKKALTDTLGDIASLPGCYINIKLLECWYIEVSVIIEDLEYTALVERLIAPFV